MTTTSEPESLGANGERRLHPLSWLFVLLQQLKQFALPLLVLLFSGRGDRNELWSLVGVGALALISLFQYFTYRFRLDAEGIVIRSGLLQKNVRHIPFERIHNVALHQTLLHRFFSVAEVRLESAGGQKPEGQMRVLSLADAKALEQLVRDHAHASPGGNNTAAAEAPEEVLLSLDNAEVLRLGLISNRGMIVVAAGFGALAQTGSDLPGNLVRAVGDGAFGWAKSAHLGVVATMVGALLLFAAFVLLLRLFSVLLALLQFHGFRLAEIRSRLVVQRGLLTQMRSSLSRKRIQAFTLHEGLLHRWFDRRSLRVDTAANSGGNEQNTLRDLVPLATPLRMDGLVAGLLPAGQWPITDWRSLHPKAWWRQFSLPAALTVVATGFLVWKSGAIGLLALLALPLFWLRAHIWARHAGYAEQQGLVAVREGWLDRHWRFVEARKLQSLRLAQSPFDRRHGMATLLLDTVGAGAMEPPLRIRYLPIAEARALQSRLAALMQA